MIFHFWLAPILVHRLRSLALLRDQVSIERLRFGVYSKITMLARRLCCLIIRYIDAQLTDRLLNIIRISIFLSLRMSFVSYLFLTVGTA